jgi:distribution and morphology protein 31
MYPASRSLGARLAHADRYSLIHTFFTRPRPPPPLIRPIPRSSTPISTLHRTFYYSSCPSHYKPFSTRATSHQQAPQQSTPTSHQNSSNLDSSPHNLYDNNYPRFFRRLAQSLPHVSRPSRDDFLNAANGFVQRMRVRVRWFFIRNFRKFNADDISAFVTWFLVGHGLWILVGTSVLTTRPHSAPSADYFQNDILFCCVCSGE